MHPSIASMYGDGSCVPHTPRPAHEPLSHLPLLRMHHQERFATAAAVPASAVDITVVAASVLITARITVPTATTSTAVSARLSATIGSATMASSVLGITVLTNPMIASSDGPSGATSTPGSFASSCGPDALREEAESAGGGKGAGKRLLEQATSSSSVCRRSAACIAHAVAKEGLGVDIPICFEEDFRKPVCRNGCDVAECNHHDWKCDVGSSATRCLTLDQSNSSLRFAPTHPGIISLQLRLRLRSSFDIELADGSQPQAISFAGGVEQQLTLAGSTHAYGRLPNAGGQGPRSS